jgi:hypothetical protein
MTRDGSTIIYFGSNQPDGIGIRTALGKVDQ